MHGCKRPTTIIHLCIHNGEIKIHNGQCTVVLAIVSTQAVKKDGVVEFLSEAFLYSIPHLDMTDIFYHSILNKAVYMYVSMDVCMYVCFI